LDLNILTRGYGIEPRGVMVSYQAQAPVLGLVLPSNSPGVHTLWLPVIPMQIGLLLKPGPQEPWTPYRMAAAFTEAGVPKEAIAIYPGGGEMGAEVVRRSNRTMIFGGTPTVERYRGDVRVQVHGPGFTKILFGDDVVDDWEKYIDVMASSVFLNSGGGYRCSGVGPRVTRRSLLSPTIGPGRLAAETRRSRRSHSQAREAIWKSIESGLRTGDRARHGKVRARLVEKERCGYLRPVVIHCDSRSALQTTMFPFVSVVKCPQDRCSIGIGDAGGKRDHL
jgi:hypothetical protein